MRRVHWLALTLAAVTVIGCKPAVTKVGGVPRTKYYKKIVSLCPGTTEILASNGQLPALVGRSESDNYPITVKSIPVVSSVKPDLEKLTMIKPDLVVYDGDLYKDSDLQKVKDMGAELFALKAHTLDGFKKELYDLANRVGGETQYDSYIGRIDAAISPGDPAAKKPKVAVLMPGAGAFYAAGTESFLADAIKNCGAALVGPKADRFVPTSPEMLVAEQPDAIILPTSTRTASKDVSDLLADSRLRTIQAIKDKRIIPMDADVVLRRGNRVDVLLKNIQKGLGLKLGN